MKNDETDDEACLEGMDEYLCNEEDDAPSHRGGTGGLPRENFKI